MTQFLTIALANSIFKIVPNIIADRISARIISSQRSFFLRDRNISSCIVMVSENVKMLDSKIHGGNVGIKLDVAMAFDTLTWDFLPRTLQMFWVS